MFNHKKHYVRYFFSRNLYQKYIRITMKVAGNMKYAGISMTYLKIILHNVIGMRKFKQSQSGYMQISLHNIFKLRSQRSGVNWSA